MNLWPGFKSCEGTIHRLRVAPVLVLVRTPTGIVDPHRSCRDQGICGGRINPSPNMGTHSTDKGVPATAENHADYH